MQKNTAGQKFVVFAFDRTTNLPVTGDAANITANLQIDFAAPAATNDVNPTELQDGFYSFDATQAETNGDALLLLPESVTSDVQVIGVPGVIYTTDIANKVWDELMTNHTTNNTFGKTIKSIAEGWVSVEGSVNDATPAVGSFITDLTETNTSFYAGQVLIFISGNLKGQSRVVSAYNGTTKEVTFDEDFTIAPADIDQFIILTTHTHTLGKIANATMAGGDVDGYSLEEALKLILSASVGVLAGAATSSITIEAADGSKTRITATVDADGNRSVVVLDETG